MYNHFQINVSLKGKHLFATAPHSVQTKAEYDRVIEIFKKKFPRREGYEISATYVEVIGQGIEVM